jgi:hypothetical protein
MKKMILFVVVTFFGAKSFAQTDLSSLPETDRQKMVASYMQGAQLGASDMDALINGSSQQSAVGENFKGVLYNKATGKFNAASFAGQNGDVAYSYQGKTWAVARGNSLFLVVPQQATAAANPTAPAGLQQDNPQQLSGDAATAYYTFRAKQEETEQKRLDVQLAAYQVQQQQQQQQQQQVAAQRQQRQQRQRQQLWGQAPTVWNTAYRHEGSSWNQEYR